MDIQESLLDREATRYALLCGENPEVVRLAWETCAAFLRAHLGFSDLESKQELLTEIDRLIGNP